ncbi:MAG: hypothetical protein ACIAS6_05215 [Phycisphaerales bacterium JB060]
MPSIVRTYRSPQSAARGGNILVGCLAVLGVVAVLVIVGGVVLWMNWKGWMGSGMNATMKAVVQESKLPAGQQTRINTQIDQLTGAFEAGDVTMEDLMEVVQALEGHPILPVGLLEYVETNSLKAEGLTDDEKAAGELATQRIQRALVEGQMVLGDLDPILEPISQRDADGDLQPLQNPTAPQVRLYIEAAQNKADELNIPVGPYQVDVAEQIERLINDTLGREVVSAPAPAGEPAPPVDPVDPADQGDEPASEPVEDPGPVEAPAGEPEEPSDPTGGG